MYSHLVKSPVLTIYMTKVSIIDWVLKCYQITDQKRTQKILTDELVFSVPEVTRRTKLGQYTRL